MKFPMLRYCQHIVLLIAAFCCASRSPGATATDRPNIVVILADDLGYGDPGCYNSQSKIPTPNIDRLAGQGIRCTDAHAAAAVCSPSRYALLTGQYPWRTRPGGSALGVWARPIIAPDRLTLPALLQRVGYATACIGKWHLGWDWPTRDGKPPRTGADNLGNIDFTRAIPGGPIARGFDYYFGTCVPNYPPYCFIENDRTVGLPTEPSTEFETPGPALPGWKQIEILPELTRRAVRYIEAAAEGSKPFFLFFSLTSPHHPVLPLPEFRGKSGAGDYGDFVVQTDWTIGQVIEALDRTGLAKNTLVIVTSDNGPEITRTNNLGTKNVMPVGAYDRIQRYGHASMGPFRGIKYEAWEGGHRVPFVARWPARIKAGLVSDELFCQVDLMATCAAIAGIEMPKNSGEDSVDSLPTLIGGKAARATAVMASAKVPRAVRQGPWVWIDAPAGLNPEPEWYRKERGYVDEPQSSQLYDLSTDPAQRHNLGADRPEKIAELSEWLKRIDREAPRAR